MNIHEKYMARCIDLAHKGAGKVSPNPMVGCVIVHDGQIIGEGYHMKHGEAHAEVNAINSVNEKQLLSESTLYVSLEPCAHFGLTPPCSDLIIKNNIPEVFIGTIDPFAEVAGKGIEKMQKAGIKVSYGILEKECLNLNRRFFTFHQRKRPYVILKWAKSSDGFIDVERKEDEIGEPTWITGHEALTRVHELRATEDAILVGTKTALKDNPSLTVRHCEGKNPLRVVLDQNLRLPETLNLFDQQARTIVFNSQKDEVRGNILYKKLDFSEGVASRILDRLADENVLSVIIEGGKQVLETFIKENLWDEAMVYTGTIKFGAGIESPNLPTEAVSTEFIEKDQLAIYMNHI